MKPAAHKFAVPTRWEADVAEVLVPALALTARVQSLAREIERDYQKKDFVIVSLLTGTVLFLADLIRAISLPMRLDFIGVSSYRDGTEARELVFTKELRLDVRGRNVLLVDDILDTGQTLDRVIDKVQQLKPADLKVCVLLEKKARRIKEVKADYVGFEIPDLFVVGYGLDFAERYRNLPFLGVLHPHIYKAPPA